MLSLRRYLNVVYTLLIEKTRQEGVPWSKAQGEIDKAIAPPEDPKLVAARENAEAMKQLGMLLGGITPKAARA